MKKGKPIILLLTLLLAAIAVVFGSNEIGMQNFPFSVIITSDGVQEELRCMKLRDEYYLFLPSYAQDENARILTNPVYDVFLDGQKLEKGQSCGQFPTDTKMELHFQSVKNEGYETITFVKTQDMPTLYIDVPSGNMEYIHEEKGNAEPGRLRVYTEDGALNYSGALETIKGRGNNTWMGDKKPYSLELNQEADLLGMGAANRWILLTNANDHTHLRNKVFYDMARVLNMPFSPESTWVHLYLNGEYTGLYLLTERNEIHPQRVAIAQQGSFLVALEPDWRLQQHGYPYVQTKSGMAFRIHNSTLPSNTLQEIWQAAENAIFSQDGFDPVSGKSWDKLIDMDSWARKYLMEEIFGNADVMLASEFFYYQESDARIYAGPIWDMDATCRMTEEPWLSYRSILAGRPRLTSPTHRNLFYELLQKPVFADRVKELYQKEFRPYLCQLLDGELEKYAKKTQEAILSHVVRWPTGDREKSLAYMRSFIEKRMEFLDDCWIYGKELFLIQVLQADRVWAFAVYPGENLEGLPDPEAGIWYRLDTEEILDKTLPVDGDMVIGGKVPDPA